jgi:predicted O-methyltransferase YrrM
MLDTVNLNPPSRLKDIEEATQAIRFAMASDQLTGSLLRTLATTKPAATFLELGTGTGMGTAWLLDGMDSRSTLLTVDNDEQAISVAQRYLGQDKRVTFYTRDGAVFLQELKDQGLTVDFIFADTWPGKYTQLEDALQLLNVGGLYVLDDMLPQPSWPEDHTPKVSNLISVLERRRDLRLTKLNWSTGLIVAAKLASD